MRCLLACLLVRVGLHVSGAPYEPPKHREFAAGDRVKVELDPEVWQLLQNGHGGWNDMMAMVCELLGSMYICGH